MKLRYLSAFACAAISIVPGMYSKASSQTQPDYACFLTTPAGQTVDFSQSSLCGAQKTASAPLNPDEGFLAAYKSSAMQYTDVRDRLLATAAQSPATSIMQAKRVCSELKSGLSLDEIKQKQSNETVEQTSIVNAQIVTNLATRFYCPNLAK